MASKQERFAQFWKSCQLLLTEDETTRVKAHLANFVKGEECV